VGNRPGNGGSPPAISLIFLAYATYQAVVTLPSLVRADVMVRARVVRCHRLPGGRGAGIVLALWLKAKRPVIYQGIGWA